MTVADTNGCAVDVRGKIARWDLRDRDNRTLDPEACPAASLLAAPFEAVTFDTRTEIAVDLRGRKFRWFGVTSGWLPFSGDRGIARSIASGTVGSCSVFSDGDLGCIAEQPFARWLQQETSVAHVSVGDSHVCMARRHGQLSCTGTWNYTPRADATDSRSVFHLGEDIQQIASGAAHACAVTKSGALFCVGNNWYAQVTAGRANSDEALPVVVNPIRIVLPQPVSRVALGKNYTCAVLHDRTVYCWGFGAGSALGMEPDGPYFPSELDAVQIPSRVPFVRDVVQISAGGTACSPQVCTIDSAGALTCWGAKPHKPQTELVVFRGLHIAEPSWRRPLSGADFNSGAAFRCLTRERAPVPICAERTPKGLAATDPRLNRQAQKDQRITVTGRLVHDCLGWGALGCLEYQLSLDGVIPITAPELYCGEQFIDCGLRRDPAYVTVSGMVTHNADPLGDAASPNDLPRPNHPRIRAEWVCERAQ